VSAGYFVTPNATEYEFDFNVYSPLGTVVFEAIFIAENPDDLLILSANFDGQQTNYDPFSINGETDPTSSVSFNPPITTNTLLTITLDQILDPTDGEVDFEFQLAYFAAGIEPGSDRSDAIDITIHEIGKLLSTYVAIL